MRPLHACALALLACVACSSAADDSDSSGSAITLSEANVTELKVTAQNVVETDSRYNPDDRKNGWKLALDGKVVVDPVHDGVMPIRAPVYEVGVAPGISEIVVIGADKGWSQPRTDLAFAVWKSLALGESQRVVCEKDGEKISSFAAFVIDAKHPDQVDGPITVKNWNKDGYVRRYTLQECGLDKSFEFSPYSGLKKGTKLYTAVFPSNHKLSDSFEGTYDYKLNLEHPLGSDPDLEPKDLLGKFICGLLGLFMDCRSTY
jgi:hypothetical protein